MGCLIVIMLYLCLHLKYYPHNKNFCNILETMSSIISLITLFIGMYYIDGKASNYLNNTDIQWLFFFIIIIANLVFISYWIYYFRIELLKTLYKKNYMIIFKLVSCFLISSEKFEKMHLKTKGKKYESEGSDSDKYPHDLNNR